MTYKTQPGTIAHMAIEHLKTLPPGTLLSTVELSAAIGHPGMDGFASCMATARANGLIIAAPHELNRRILLWSLGDGTVPHRTPDPDDDGEDDNPRIVIHKK